MNFLLKRPISIDKICPVMYINLRRLNLHLIYYPQGKIIMTYGSSVKLYGDFDGKPSDAIYVSNNLMFNPEFGSEHKHVVGNDHLGKNTYLAGQENAANLWLEIINSKPQVAEAQTAKPINGVSPSNLASVLSNGTLGVA